MELFEALQEGLWALVSGLLVIAIPVLARAAIQWVRATLTAKEMEVIDKVISMAVSTVQQLKANGVIGDGEAALDYALSVAQREFDRLGIKLDVDTILDAIEAVYNSEQAWTVKEFSAAALKELIDSYVGSNVGDEAKKLAAVAIERYLKQFGISVDLDVLEALALDELAKLVK